MKSTIKIDYERSFERTPVIKIIIPYLEKDNNGTPGDLDDDDVRDGLVRDLIQSPCMASPNHFFEVKTTFPIGDHSRLTTIGAIIEGDLMYRFRHAILNRFVSYAELVACNEIKRTDDFDTNTYPVPLYYDRFVKINDFFDWLDKTERPAWEKQQFNEDKPEMFYPKIINPTEVINE